MKADCTKCRHMYHMQNKRNRPDTMFCNALGHSSPYCCMANPHGGCRNFSPLIFNKMSITDAKQILQKNRPERPRSTEQRQFQAAIDTIMEYLNEYYTEE